MIKAFLMVVPPHILIIITNDKKIVGIRFKKGNEGEAAFYPSLLRVLPVTYIT